MDYDSKSYNIPKDITKKRMNNSHILKQEEIILLYKGSKEYYEYD